MVFVLPADEVYEKDLLKSGFPQQSSVTSSSEPAGARPPSLAVMNVSLQNVLNYTTTQQDFTAMEPDPYSPANSTFVIKLT